MRPLGVALSMGVAFSAGMLVPLVGLHATENFRFLDYFGLIRADVVSAGEPVIQPRSLARPQAAAADTSEPRVVLAALNRPAASAPTPRSSAAAEPLSAEGAIPPSANEPAAADEPTESDDPPAADAGSAATLSKAQIADIQTYLAVRGFEVGTIDGLLGPQTHQAIRAFQAESGVPVTGAASVELLAALTAPQTRERKASPPLPETVATAGAVEPLPVDVADDRGPAEAATAPSELVQTSGAPVPLSRWGDSR